MGLAQRQPAITELDGAIKLASGQRHVGEDVERAQLNLWQVHQGQRER